MTKARNIADLGSNDVIETTATGVDVTGTVTADGLTVDGSVTTQLNGSNYTYSGTNYDVHALIGSGSGGIRLGADSVTANSFIGGVGANDIDVVTYNGSAWGKRVTFENNGDVSFYEDTGTTAKMVWDASAEKLTIDGSEEATSLSTAVTGSVLELNGNSGGSAASWFGSVSGGGQYVQSSNSSGTTSYDFLINPYGGNVGIGSASPRGNLSLGSAATGQVVDKSIHFGYTTTDNYGWKIEHSQNPSSVAAGDFKFVRGTTTSWAESARFDNNGNLLVGTTTGGGVGTTISKAASGPLTVYNQSYGNGWTNVSFRYNGAQVGQIYSNTSSTVFATSSDYRLKENVVTMENASDRVKALKPCRFNFISYPDTTVDGFLAHEAQEVVPEAVTGTKDAVDADGNPEYQGIDQSKLVPLLTKALQEAITKIEQLETRIETLENN